MSGGWNTIESDAGVFTELVEKLQVRSVQFQELWSIDTTTLQSIEPVYGVIFLFKYGATDQQEGPLDGKYDFECLEDNSVFFAKQRIQNACATQAVLNILLNRDDEINIGEELSQFKEFVGGFDADLKGDTISNSDLIRSVHNSFSRPSAFIDESQKKHQSSDDDGLYHFIAYAPINGKIYELDGLHPAPIYHCDCPTPQDFTSLIPDILQKRIQHYAATELRFSLLAIVKDRREYYRDIGDIEMVAREEEKRDGWRRDNLLRRQDFTALVYELTKGMSKQMADEEWGEMVQNGKRNSFMRSNVL